MQSAIESFATNLQRVRTLGALHNGLKKVTTPALDISDVLRCELVLAVSALDSYIHEIVEKGMLEVYSKKRSMTESFLRFNISLKCVLAGLSASPETDWLRDEIHEILHIRSFQHPDRISEAMKLISDKRVWDEVSAIMGKDPSDIKKHLALIVDRRNKIAHEADNNPAFYGSRWPIDETMVNEAVDFLEALANAVHKVATS